MRQVRDKATSCNLSSRLIILERLVTSQLIISNNSPRLSKGSWKRSTFSPQVSSESPPFRKDTLLLGTNKVCFHQVWGLRILLGCMGVVVDSTIPVSSKVTEVDPTLISIQCLPCSTDKCEMENLMRKLPYLRLKPNLSLMREKREMIKILIHNLLLRKVHIKKTMVTILLTILHQRMRSLNPNSSYQLIPCMV